MQLVGGQCLEHGQHGSSLSLCGGQVHVAVVAALHLACAGDIALERSHEAEGLHCQAQRLGGGQAPGQQVKAGAAAHGADVDDAVLILAVAGVGGEEVLQRVGCAGGEIIAVVRLCS